MKPALALFAASAFLAAAALFAGVAAAQSSPPAQSAAPAATPAQPPQKPAGRPLILRLDEVDGPRMSIGPTATEKPPEKDLPTLGGRPSKDWDRPNQQVFPIDSERANQTK